jgi:polyhydroxyalkanoate synthase subunit PhaC
VATKQGATAAAMAAAAAEPTAKVDEKRPSLFAEQRRLWSRLWSVPRVFRQARETRVGTTPAEVVLAEGTHRLMRYRRETPASYGEPVLFCYALVNRAYILDLQPDKSVVQQYLKQGFDVYLIDWGVPTDADRRLTLEHYVCGFLQRAVEWIRERQATDRVHLLGYCMGGTMTTLLTALRPELVRSLTLLAAPIDFCGHDGLLNLWTDPRHFDVDAVVDAFGNCPAWFLQTCFLFMNPVANLIEKNISFYEQMDDPRSMTNHFALESWVNDGIPVAGETFREFVKSLYQRNLLVKGELSLGGRRVDLARITCPLLLLTAKNDHLVIPASTEGVRPHVTTTDIESMEIGAGHVGLVVSSRAHKSFWPAATRWLGDRSTPLRSGRERQTNASQTNTQEHQP